MVDDDKALDRAKEGDDGTEVDTAGAVKDMASADGCCIAVTT